ncbi:GNAT family N-acetyltransferase [Kitasatospora sp. NBC_00374]|uniref:GNAT family N-acetyltransferase n=1 Tax=Kitasatospora sp. NBC_00374 TaxID=2975964 RepID=UPI0030E33E85
MPKTVTYLEMTAPAELRPAPALPDLGLLRVDSSSPLVRTTPARIGAPHGWRSTTRTAGEWAAAIEAHPRRQYWLLNHRADVAGVAFLEPQPGGQVEITTFGLLPERVGQGLGGYALTLALRQAWATEPLEAAAVRRVWLHTSSDDHPNALANYHRRGLRTYRVEAEDEADRAIL